jgi:hypothetical protein
LQCEQLLLLNTISPLRCHRESIATHEPVVNRMGSFLYSMGGGFWGLESYESEATRQLGSAIHHNNL